MVGAFCATCKVTSYPCLFMVVSVQLFFDGQGNTKVFQGNKKISTTKSLKLLSDFFIISIQIGSSFSQLNSSSTIFMCFPNG